MSAGLAVASSSGRLLTFFFLLGLLFWSSLASSKDRQVWSDTNPPIHLVHVFEGEINRKGKPTGFHHVTDLSPSGTARISKKLEGPNQAGVYTAIVEIYDQKRRQWKEKFSSLFPSHLSRKTLIKAILNAYHQDELDNPRKWRGPSGYGFKIEGYLLKNGRIITAYPLYKKDGTE